MFSPMNLPSKQSSMGNSSSKFGSRPLSGNEEPNRFYISPSGSLLFFWLGIVSLVSTYNIIVISYRVSFAEINHETKYLWFFFDYSADFVYILDIIISLQIGYYDEDGVLQLKARRIYIRYINSTLFYLDLLSLLPLDFLYISFGFITYVRIFRLVKFYKLWFFIDRLERHTNYVNLVRALKIIYYLLLFLHLNSCLYNRVLFHIAKKEEELSLNGTHLFCEYLHVPTTISTSVGGEDVNDGTSSIPSSGSHTKLVVSRVGNNSSQDAYLNALLWAVHTLTLMNNNLSNCNSNFLRIFFIIENVTSFLLFATVIGSVNNIVTHASADRKDFQYRLDRVKHFLTRRNVPEELNNKVIQWFDYLWMSKNTINEDKITRCLPDKLKAEIAIHVHLNTLKRVEIFQNTEDGFLSELVIRLKSQLFSPGDYICKKGEIGKQMFIVSKGRLQVLGEDEKTVLVTLKAGGYFGEISILNISNQGNRRTASVRSVGFSNLYCLSKTDLWDVLKDYPNERAKLELVAQKRLEKIKETRQNSQRDDKQSPESICSETSNETFSNISRCKSSRPPRLASFSLSNNPTTSSISHHLHNNPNSCGSNRHKSSCTQALSNPACSQFYRNDFPMEMQLHVNSMSAIDNQKTKSYQMLNQLRESFSNYREFPKNLSGDNSNISTLTAVNQLHPVHSCLDMQSNTSGLMNLHSPGLLSTRISGKKQKRESFPTDAVSMNNITNSNQMEDSFPSLALSYVQKSFENLNSRRVSRNATEGEYNLSSCIPEIRFQAASSNFGSRIFDKEATSRLDELSEKIDKLTLENEKLRLEIIRIETGHEEKEVATKTNADSEPFL